jgi:plastocyanin
MEGSATPQRQGRGLAYLGVAIAVVALILGVVAVAVPMLQRASAPTTRTFYLSSDLLNMSNRWHPASLVAYGGDTVVFNITNRGVAVHGFTVEGLGIADTVDPQQRKEFTVPNVVAGLYRYYCHLHVPGHIGGQLLVLSR